MSPTILSWSRSEEKGKVNTKWNTEERWRAKRREIEHRGRSTEPPDSFQHAKSLDLFHQLWYLNQLNLLFFAHAQRCEFFITLNLFLFLRTRSVVIFSSTPWLFHHTQPLTRSVVTFSSHSTSSWLFRTLTALWLFDCFVTFCNIL
jgi:hypothetical protein